MTFLVDLKPDVPKRSEPSVGVFDIVLDGWIGWDDQEICLREVRLKVAFLHPCGYV